MPWSPPPLVPMPSLMRIVVSSSAVQFKRLKKKSANYLDNLHKILDAIGDNMTKAIKFTY
jgi:hypothetical protein